MSDRTLAPRFASRPGLPRVAIVAAGAASPLGFAWRGLGRAVIEATEGAPIPGAGPVPEIPRDLDPADARARKLMSKVARLSAVALAAAVREAGVAGLEDAGLYLGVGASSGSLPELTAALRASMEDGAFSLARYGQQGLLATNPLSAFGLMHNFTLCHAAILLGIGGPNGAFFSRGGGTVTALAEAAHAVATGECDRAFAGGADSALHEATRAELARAGHLAAGLVPSEGAAVLALAPEGEGALAVVERCGLARVGDRSPGEVAAELYAGLDEPDLVVIAPWGDAARGALREAAGRWSPCAALADASRAFGEALAAAPALAWVAALDLLAQGDARRALILSAGLDGQLGAVALARPS